MSGIIATGHHEVAEFAGNCSGLTSRHASEQEPDQRRSDSIRKLYRASDAGFSQTRQFNGTKLSAHPRDVGLLVSLSV
jgi:hypothetical protein